MPKRELKERISIKQQRRDAINGTPLARDPKLYDTDRVIPKAQGGTYTDENTRTLNPITHMERHLTHKVRTPELEVLKNLMDERVQVKKLLYSFNNRVLASMRETDQLNTQMKEWLDQKSKEIESQLGKIDREITKYILSLNLPIVQSALKVYGLGPITIASLLTYIEIDKAEYASSLWSYVGLDKPSYERYTKGITGGGNKTLRTTLYTMADSMIRTGSVYRGVYDNEKFKLSNSLLITKTYNTEGKLVEAAWKDTKPSHRHGAAIRKMIKHFLADFWYVWRTLEGLPTPDLYVEARMGHTGIVKPQERGWIF